jgi:ribonuclease P protein component
MTGSVPADRNARAPISASFTRNQKLTKPIEFKEVFKKPFVSSDRFFKVLARINQAEYSRLGMAVSRQVDKRAVGRNRIKRVIRESFRQRYAGNKVTLDVVVLPRHETASICNEQLFRSLSGHWSRLENQFEG